MEQYRSSLAPRTQRRSQNFRSDSAKIRLSEGKTKENLVFFCFSEPMEQREPSCLHVWPSRDRGKRS